MDSRVLNSMLSSMGERSRNAGGLMSVHEFKQMFFMAFRQADRSSIAAVYEMLVPLILQHEKENHRGLTQAQMDDLAVNGQIGECKCQVSIEQLSNFVDFFNYQPVMMQTIVHPNDSNKDIYTYMGHKEPS